MIQRRARPEDAHLAIDAFVRDAVVVGDAAARGLAQFLEDLARMLKRKQRSLAQSPRDVADDRAVDARVAGRIDGLLNVDDAPLGAADDALLFFLKAAGKHDVRVMCGL